MCDVAGDMWRLWVGAGADGRGRTRTEDGRGRTREDAGEDGRGRVRARVGAGGRGCGWAGVRAEDRRRRAFMLGRRGGDCW